MAATGQYLPKTRPIIFDRYAPVNGYQKSETDYHLLQF